MRVSGAERLRIEAIDRTCAAMRAPCTPAERAGMIRDCYRWTRILPAAGERFSHPRWSDQQVSLAVS